jgi:hypothetical protein
VIISVFLKIIQKKFDFVFYSYMFVKTNLKFYTMKKIVLTVLLTTSALLFAKNETPNTKMESGKVAKTVLVAKKTIETDAQQQKPITLSTTGKEKELTTEELCIIELALGPVIAGPAYHCLQLGS